MGFKKVRRKIIPYNPKLKPLARALRKNMTLSEVLLWQELKGKNVMGYDFDRQRPIDNFIVDFYCKELQLAMIAYNLNITSNHDKIIFHRKEIIA